MDEQTQIEINIQALSLNDLKEVAKANNIKANGTAKADFIDAIAEFTETSELAIPYAVTERLKAANDIKEAKEAKPEKKLPAGTFEYVKSKEVDGQMFEIKTVHLTELQANTLNAQRNNSGYVYVKK